MFNIKVVIISPLTYDFSVCLPSSTLIRGENLYLRYMRRMGKHSLGRRGLVWAWINSKHWGLLSKMGVLMSKLLNLGMNNDSLWEMFFWLTGWWVRCLWTSPTPASLVDESSLDCWDFNFTLVIISSYRKLISLLVYGHKTLVITTNNWIVNTAWND